MQAQATERRLSRTSERQFDVLVDGERIGSVWRSATDADTAKRWRASAPNGVEWRAWAFYATPQAAAVACVREHEHAS